MSKPMKAKLNEFKTYLQQNKGYIEKTAKYSLFCINEYLQWLKDEKLSIKKVSYKDILNYIGSLQQRSCSKSKINHQLRTISQYNEFLKVSDPAKDVRLRGVKKEGNAFLSEAELNQIYQNFESKNKKGHYLYSDKIMVGLVIYQALEEKDVFRLELNDLDLEKGKIYVKGGLKTKEARILDLQAFQIIPLKNYIDNYRKKYHKDHEQQESEKLFTPNCDKPHRLHDQFKIIAKALKEQAEKEQINLPKIGVLRQSRIVLWIKQYGLRKAQYLGGFRAINGVERYQQEDITDLQDYIKAHHPLK
jgi:integrase/recombinase XerD